MLVGDLAPLGVALNGAKVVDSDGDGLLLHGTTIGIRVDGELVALAAAGAGTAAGADAELRFAEGGSEAGSAWSAAGVDGGGAVGGAHYVAGAIGGEGSFLGLQEGREEGRKGVDAKLSGHICWFAWVFRLTKKSVWLNGSGGIGRETSVVKN